MKLLRSPRQFSTAAKVHPAYLQRLNRQSGRMPFRWLKPLVAVLAVGYGVRTYTIMRRERFTVDDQRLEAESRRNEALLDQYGDRDSLESLEKAVQFYEKRRP
ncbi:hypothetical protein N3K66_005988 [Trichothecium roseum]|uniref:Uncharacterized protein n=1 Tax=Trichothecium roseum TaxID=47278 RepID=A0ACC0UZE5_9HYPO|nr:hypothetical protein N3K66_005988 [Trichothecium roseum]